MKFQKYKWTYLIVGTFSFCFCLAFIYQQFHHDSGHKIENITIKPKKVVKTPSIDFKINSIDVRKSATSVDTQVKMHIDRKNLSQLNMVDQNFNLANNMFLNIPFEDSSPSDLVTTESGKNVTYQDLKNHN